MHIEFCCSWVCVASWYTVVCGVRCVVRGMWLADIRVWRVLCGVWCGVAWSGEVWFGAVLFSVEWWCGLVCCCMVRCKVV